MTRPVVVMPDAELVALKAIRDFLASRSESFCQGVTVDRIVKAGATPAKFVRVRRLGGGTRNTVTDLARLDLVIWHDSPAKRMALGQMLRGFLEAMIGTFDGVACYGGATFMVPQQMPDPADDTREVVMLTVDVAMRGTQLA